MVEKAKGAYPLTMTDLDDVTYPTRSKTDLVQRERELYLVLRMMDIEKREYVMTTDMAIQPELYRSTICEMSDICGQAQGLTKGGGQGAKGWKAGWRFG